MPLPGAAAAGGAWRRPLCVAQHLLLLRRASTSRGGSGKGGSGNGNGNGTEREGPLSLMPLGQEDKTQSMYRTTQFYLHRTLGRVGVATHRWRARHINYNVRSFDEDDGASPTTGQHATGGGGGGGLSSPQRGHGAGHRAVPPRPGEEEEGEGRGASHHPGSDAASSTSAPSVEMADTPGRHGYRSGGGGGGSDPAPRARASPREVGTDPQIPLLCIDHVARVTTSKDWLPVPFAIDSVYEISTEQEVTHPLVYQTLCDTRGLGETMGFWSHSRGLTHGLDYVGHDDMLPIALQVPALQHPLFDRLFRTIRDPNGHLFIDGSDQLYMWAHDSSAALQHSSVYSCAVKGFRVTVLPLVVTTPQLQRRAGGKPISQWFYKVDITVLDPVLVAEDDILLVSQTLIVQDAEQETQVIMSKGVRYCTGDGFGPGFANAQPVFSRRQQHFQYTSRMMLSTASGRMGGFFTLCRNGDRDRLFTIPIPTFELKGGLEEGPSLQKMAV